MMKYICRALTDQCSDNFFVVDMLAAFEKTLIAERQNPLSQDRETEWVVEARALISELSARVLQSQVRAMTNPAHTRYDSEQRDQIEDQMDCSRTLLISDKNM